VKKRQIPAGLLNGPTGNHVFTGVSIARSFVLRRLFEAIRVRRVWSNWSIRRLLFRSVVRTTMTFDEGWQSLQSRIPKISCRHQEVGQRHGSARADRAFER